MDLRQPGQLYSLAKAGKCLPQRAQLRIRAEGTIRTLGFVITIGCRRLRDQFLSGTRHTFSEPRFPVGIGFSIPAYRLAYTKFLEL